MMTSLWGSTRTSIIVSLVYTRGPSAPGMAGTMGRDPVQMNTSSASSSSGSVLLSMRRVWGATNEAVPSTTEMRGWLAREW